MTRRSMSCCPKSLGPAGPRRTGDVSRRGRLTTRRSDPSRLVTASTISHPLSEWARSTSSTLPSSRSSSDLEAPGNRVTPKSADPINNGGPVAEGTIRPFRHPVCQAFRESSPLEHPLFACCLPRPPRVLASDEDDLSGVSGLGRRPDSGVLAPPGARWPLSQQHLATFRPVPYHRLSGDAFGS